MKKKILKIASTIIVCALTIIMLCAFCVDATGTSTFSEAYIPSETIATEVTLEEITQSEPTVEKHETPIVLAPAEVVRVETRDKQELETLIATANEKLQAAQSMLESCQILGYEEDNPVVVLANQEVANAQADIDHYQAILDEVMVEIRAAERMEEYPVATTIWIYLTETLGYNDYVAAGVVGNMMTEVGGQTLNIQPGLYGHGTNKGYYGICQ